MTTDPIAAARSYRKRPVVIEAIQYTGDNLREVLEFAGKHPHWDKWFASFEDYETHVCADRQVFKIMTLEGTMEALPGDWIIKGVKGEFYPCKPDIFDSTYDPVEAAMTTDWMPVEQIVNAFSGSLDAAVALFEALLPGWAIERMASWPGRCCRVSLWGTHDLGGERWHSCEDGRIDAEGPTLARALLLATLRAYRSTREGG